MQTMIAGGISCRVRFHVSYAACVWREVLRGLAPHPHFTVLLNYSPSLPNQTLLPFVPCRRMRTLPKLRTFAFELIFLKLKLRGPILCILMPSLACREDEQECDLYPERNVHCFDMWHRDLRFVIAGLLV